MRYPIGIQSFEQIIKGGYVYIDKTEHIFNLRCAGKYFFLSRPRRFGKSLLLSTMKAYFEGRRELFQGLAIEGLEHEWVKYPVFYIDINSGKYKDPGSLAERLNIIMDGLETEYDSPAPMGMSVEYRFERLVKLVCEKCGRGVVILIDEYDKPLLETINDPELQDDNRATLKAFYSVLKTQDAYIRFAFLTGVTKFAHVSIFSDLNNLQDISMDLRYAYICGLTQREIENYFDEQVGALAANNSMTKEEGYAELRAQYDGYHFHPNAEGVYNPFSVLNALDSKEFGSYWFATGTPTFLVEMMKESDFELHDMTTMPAKIEMLNVITDFHSNPMPVLYQSGYLTIKSYSAKFKTYLLDFPNEEVRSGLLDFLLPAYSPVRPERGPYYIQNFVGLVRTGQAEDFIRLLKEFFSSGDYRVAGSAELYFQNSMYVVFKLLGLYVDVETATARGRIDLTLQTKDYIYIMELKLDGSADEALRQIEERGYADKFATDSRRLYRIGINFGSESRTIEDYRIE